MVWRPTSVQAEGRLLFAHALPTALEAHFDSVADVLARAAFAKPGRINRTELRRAIVEEATIKPLVLGSPEYAAPRKLGRDRFHTLLECSLGLKSENGWLLDHRAPGMHLERPIRGNWSGAALVLSTRCIDVHLRLAELALQSDVALITRHVEAQRSYITEYINNLTKTAMVYISDRWSFHENNRPYYAQMALLASLANSSFFNFSEPDDGPSPPKL